MRVLLDTSVLSEVHRPAPDAAALNWLADLDEDRAFISVVSIAEIRRGIGLLDIGRRKAALANWLENDLAARFAGRIIGVDTSIALAWGDVMSAARKRGVALSAMDGWLAATALARDLSLATRNVKDFQASGVRLIDPWVSSFEPPSPA